MAMSEPRLLGAEEISLVMDAAGVILRGLNDHQDKNLAEIKRVFPDSQPKKIDYQVEAWTAAQALFEKGMLREAKTKPGGTE